MADSPESIARVSRHFSPITRPSSPVAIKSEDVEMTTAPEVDPPFSVSTQPEDKKSHPGAESDHSGSAPSPDDETAFDTTGDISTVADTTGDVSMTADTTGDISTASIETRCVVNFLDPQPGKCDSKITDDDRHYISNFFGRNKSCSTSIPDEYYQVLCRKCMQAMKYRLKTSRGASEIQVQVAAIKHALRNMAASGRWVFVEVQLTKSEYDRRQDPEKYDTDIKKFNEDVIKSREEAKAKGEKVRRRNTKKLTTPVPDWLAELVVNNNNSNNKDTDKDYFAIHERKPTPWTFEDLIGLVDLIGENCEALPSIECLVITQGELDRAELGIAHECCTIAREEHDRLRDDIAELEEKLKKAPKNNPIQVALKDFQDRMAEVDKQIKVAEEDIKKAAKICEGSKHTLPPKRLQLRTATKGESSKTAAKKGKGKKAETSITQTQRDNSDDRLPDQDPTLSRRRDTPSPKSILEVWPESPSPTPGWKGKGKEPSPSPPYVPASPSTPEAEPGSPLKHSESSRTTQQLRPTNPPAHLQAGLPLIPFVHFTTMTTTPGVRTAIPTLAPARAPVTSKHRTSGTASTPVTPTQPTSGAGSAHTPTSTTRSAGRRLQRAAELEQRQQQQRGQGLGHSEAHSEARGVKREADDDDDDEQHNGTITGTAVTEQGSPARKKAKRG
jgi:hypothetical protein